MAGFGEAVVGNLDGGVVVRDSVWGCATGAGVGIVMYLVLVNCPLGVEGGVARWHSVSGEVPGVN